MAPVDFPVLKPGELGEVTHSIKDWVLNGWTKCLNVDEPRYYPGAVMFNDHLYELDSHIQGGTILFILSKNRLRTVGEDFYSDYYEVIWGELKVLIKCDYLVVPYLT